MIVTGPCITCGKVFAYHPHKVPSTTALTGNREPVCEGCMRLINNKRTAKGLEPFPILPGAYEAADESEL
jgi:hypothetical protein